MPVTRRNILKSGSVFGTTVLGALAGCIAEENGDGEDQDFPQNTINYLVPAPAGGGIDTYARTFAPEVSDELGVNIQVQNEPGGGQWNAIGSLVAGEADGYTISGALLPGVQVNALLNPPDVDIDDVGFVCGQGGSHTVLVTNPDNDQFENDLEAAFDAVRDEEHTDIAVAEGGGTHVAAEIMANRFDLPFEPIGYDGSAEQNQAVASGEAAFGMSTDEAAIDLVDEGTVIPVGVLTSSRIDSFPDTPSLVEDLGYDSIDYATLFARPIIIHNDTSQDRKDILADAFQSATESDAIQDWADSNGFGVEFMPEEEIEEIWEQSFDEIPNEVDLDELA